VVGPSGDAARVGTGLGATARLRTTLGASETGAGALSTDAAGTTGVAGVLTGVGVGATRAGTSVVGAEDDGLDVLDVADRVDVAAAVDFATLGAFVASSGWISRRRPSASARRRMRSAWASSIDAEGLEAPIPSFWASESNSLLVIPSSLESSCTLIFFCATAYPYFALTGASTVI